MKHKHVIVAFSLSIALGLGIFAGLSVGNQQMKEARAETQTIYFKDVNWWAADGAYTAVYAWDKDDDSVKNAAWPGVRMDLVNDEHVLAGGNVFSYELDTSIYDKMIFVRVNGSGDIADWGAKTADLDVPTDDKKMYVATSASPVWGNPGIEGEWQTYVAPTAVTYSVKRNDSDYYKFDFVSDDANKPEGTKHQFKATVTNAYRGNTLAFYADGSKITANIGVDSTAEGPIAGNNLVGNVTDGFLIYHTVDSLDVYLKVYTDGGMSLWATGYAENVFYVSGIATSLSIDNDFEPTGEYIKQYKTANAVNLAVKADDAEKYYISDVPGATQTINFETAGDNNAYKSTTPAGSFNVYNACSEVVYLKMKADLSLWLYIGGRVHEHVLQVGAIEYTMSLVGDEYKASNVNMTAGETLNVTIDDVAVDGLTAKAIHNNNLTADMKALVNATNVDVYYNPNTKVLWVGGIPSDGYHIIKNGTTLVEMTHGEDFDGFVQWYSASIEFAVDDTIVFVDASTNRGNNLPNVFGINRINSAGYASKFTILETDPVQLKCLEACSAQVYMKLKAGLDEVYFGEEAEQVGLAKEFANKFEQDMFNSCSQTEDKQSYVEYAWASSAYAYNLLDASVKAVLAEGSTSSVKEIRDFAERYTAIKIQHADWSLDNFMGWDIPTFANYLLGNVVKNNNTVLIVAIASFGVISAIGLFFIIRKKKHQ